MSDLAAPLLFVMRDEAEAFWAFAALMDRCEANFHTDCTCAQCCRLAVSDVASHTWHEHARSTATRSVQQTQAS
jgi:Rab-GTPase-TBC domain